MSDDSTDRYKNQHVTLYTDPATLSTPEQRALRLSLAMIGDPGSGVCVRLAVKALREERALALDKYADFVRDTWGQAYSTEFFPVRDLNQFDSHVRTVVSASMGRHMAKRIEEQLRARAAEVRQSK